MAKLSVRDLDLMGRRVLMRVDFNVPLDEHGNIIDDTRIRGALPTIQYVLERGGKLVLMSHLGRPKGKVVPSMSLRPVAKRLSELLGREVAFADDCISEEAYQKSLQLKEGECLLLENLRFHPGEEANDPEFARLLARLGEVYVNDAFGTAHRAHASTEGVTHYIDRCAAGLLMEKELTYLLQAIVQPKRPFVAIIGGAKISGKIDVIQNLLDKVDSLLVGGGMIFTFFKAQGLEIGRSILEEDKIELARDLLNQIRDRKLDFHLPSDVLVADKIEAGATTQTVPPDRIPKDWIGVDIGPETIRSFSEKVRTAQTVVWNGPLGIFEIEAFSKGTVEIARCLAEATERGALSIVGGGDSIAAVRKAGVEGKITHISTGGGASLELLGGKKLPGVEALTDKLDDIAERFKK